MQLLNALFLWLYPQENALCFFREDNNVVALMNLQMDKNTIEKGRSLNDPDQTERYNKEVYKTIQESVNSGRVGALKLDPQYLVFEPQSCKYSCTKTKKIKKVKNDLCCICMPDAFSLPL